MKFDKHIAKVLAVGKSEEIECLVHADDTVKMAQILEGAGAEILGHFPFIGVVSVRATKEMIRRMPRLQGVKFVSSHSQVVALVNVAKKILGADTLGKEFQGTIAYIDTGICPHLDFCLGKKRIKKFVDLINHRVFPYDDNGHGTFVAGVGSGSGLVSGGKFSGLCPESEIVAIKALDGAGIANATHILEAMQWVYDNHKKYGVKVVCMSFGSDPLGPTDPILQGAEKLWDEGIVVVSAAGNSGPEFETIKSPGISRKIITVGAFDDNRLENDEFLPELFEIADFSSRGPALDGFKPDVVAPGVDIASCGVDDFYVRLSGTSVATPMIAGLCGILLARHPNLKPAEIKRALAESCTPISFNRNTEGWGRAGVTPLSLSAKRIELKF